MINKKIPILLLAVCLLLCSCKSGDLYNSENDLSYLLGNDFAKAEELLGESVPIISENTRYYKTSGVSVVYDDDTGLINYVDIERGDDSEYADRYCISRLYCGMSREDAFEVFGGLGLDKDNYDSDVWAVISGESGNRQELSVQFEKGIVKVVTIKTIR